jgi:hypothetical protein
MSRRAPALHLARAAVILLPAASLLASAGEAHAQFADPPPSQQVASGGSAQLRADPPTDFSFEPESDLSVIRFLVGPSLKADGEGAAPGFAAAVELGRGPAGARLTAAWMDVGDERGIAQYTAELTLDFGGRSRFRPMLGAGGGLARTSSSLRADGTVDADHGATLGIGVLRAGLGVRLPFEETDARVNLDVTGALPAIRGDDAPNITPWAMAALSVGFGF